MNIVMLERKNIGADVDLSKFDALGAVTVYETTKAEQIAERAKDAEVLIVNKLPINKETIGTLDRLKLLCITATGTDNVDIPYCTGRGIAVCNCKGYSTASVVQHTFAALFYVFEKLRYYDDYVKSGEYCRADIFTHFAETFYELKGKTWGIVGLGDIGRGVARAAEAFGCKVVYYSTSGRNTTKDYEQADFETLLTKSDIISIHAPLNAATQNLFSKEAFLKMKKTSYLVNMGRGPIVNETDLVEALSENQIAGAALDVISAEPMKSDNPLLKLQDSRKLFVTPHIAWATIEARTRLMDEVYGNIRAFQNGGKRNRMN